jgi:PST family polysaccharide transporter
VLANQQLEVTLALFGPAILLMIALAPLVIRLTYSSEFGPAAVQLRWQLQGDLLRSLTWPLGLYLLALGANGAYLFLEICWHVLYIILLWLTLKSFGLAAVGISFALATGVYLAVELLLLWFLVGFKLSARTVATLGLFFAFSGAALYLLSKSLALSAAVGICGSLLLTALGAARLWPSAFAKSEA